MAVLAVAALAVAAVDVAAGCRLSPVVGIGGMRQGVARIVGAGRRPSIRSRVGPRREQRLDAGGDPVPRVAGGPGCVLGDEVARAFVAVHVGAGEPALQVAQVLLGEDRIARPAQE